MHGVACDSGDGATRAASTAGISDNDDPRAASRAIYKYAIITTTAAATSICSACGGC
jgi:hypothetical protein